MLRENFIRENIIKTSLYFVAFSIPLSQYISIRLLLTIFFLIIIFRLTFHWKKLFRVSWHVLFYLLVLVAGLIYSSDVTQGLKVLETNFCFLALVLIFNTITFADELYIEKILHSYLFGLTVACIICLSSSVYVFSETHSIDSFFFYKFTDVLDFQPTYFAYFISFAISVLLYSLHYKKNIFASWIYITWVTFLFIILMLTAGRTAYIAVLLIFSFFILKYLFESRRDIQVALTFSTSVMLLICMLVVNYFDLNANLAAKLPSSDYWERITLWKSGVMANTDILLGVGTGDYRMVLNEYFLKNGLELYATENLNTHNQFIQSYLANGLVGLFSLLFLIGRPLYLSFKLRYVLGVMTFFSFLIYGVTEVFLGRYQGVIFFAFVSQVLITHVLLDGKETMAKLDR